MPQRRPAVIASVCTQPPYKTSMPLLAFLFDALKNLRANPLRSCLTLIGIVIGVAAVIAMSSIVEGGRQLTVDMIEKMGTHLLSVRPKTLNDEERRASTGRSKGLRDRDAMQIEQNIPLVKQLTPIVNVSTVLRYEDRKYEGMVEGVAAAYRSIRNHDVDRGRFLSEADVATYQKVLVIGTEVAEELFGTVDPIGQNVKVGAQRFVVVGMLQQKGSLHGINYDATILMPVTTAMKLFRGNNTLSSLIVKVASRRHMRPAEQQIKTLLLRLHDNVEDFTIRSQDELLRNTEMIILTFRIILGGTAVLALIVGGIGIMNIMLVSVLERTAEIGLRKALGATRRAVMFQFLVEATTLSVIGGIAGILLGIALGKGFGWFAQKAITGWVAIVMPEAIAWGFWVSVMIGVVFGLYPAWRAARLDPADALRYQ